MQAIKAIKSPVQNTVLDNKGSASICELFNKIDLLEPLLVITSLYVCAKATLGLIANSIVVDKIRNKDKATQLSDLRNYHSRA